MSIDDRVKLELGNITISELKVHISAWKDRLVEYYEKHEEQIPLEYSKFRQKDVDKKTASTYRHILARAMPHLFVNKKTRAKEETRAFTLKNPSMKNKKTSKKKKSTGAHTVDRKNTSAPKPSRGTITARYRTILDDKKRKRPDTVERKRTRALKPSSGTIAERYIAELNDEKRTLLSHIETWIESNTNSKVYQPFFKFTGRYILLSLQWPNVSDQQDSKWTYVLVKKATYRVRLKESHMVEIFDFLHSKLPFRIGYRIKADTTLLQAMCEKRSDKYRVESYEKTMYYFSRE